MKKQSGFSLIELLVVISIIAILTTLGLMVYGEAQKKARDAQRRMDISSISKALEMHFDTTTSAYVQLSDGWFEKGAIPIDPRSTSKYCGCSDETATDPLYADYAVVGCPLINKGGCSVAWEQVKSTVPVPVAGGTTWRVCARLEAKDEVFCKHNVQ